MIHLNKQVDILQNQFLSKDLGYIPAEIVEFPWRSEKFPMMIMLSTYTSKIVTFPILECL